MKISFSFDKRAKNKTKNEIEEKKTNELKFKNEIGPLSNEVSQLQAREYKVKLIVEEENSEKLNKLYKTGYIDENSNPLK